MIQFKSIIPNTAQTVHLRRRSRMGLGVLED